MMNTKAVFFSLIFAASSAFAVDVAVEWKAGEKPESLGDGAVSLTYDEDAVSALAVTPSDGGAVTMTGDPIQMGADASVSFGAPGTMRFSNAVETASGALTLGTPSEDTDSLYFVTGGSADSTEILSVDAAEPTLVFENRRLADYEPAYAHFFVHTAGGAKWNVAPELEKEILRPYNAAREDGALTVQFQGVTRFHDYPHTASITIKFMQDGDNIVAYVVRAAALKPLDIELGLDLDAMVDAGDVRAEGKPIGRHETGNYNISVIVMRRVHSDARKVTFAGGFPTDGSVKASGDVALEFDGEQAMSFSRMESRDGYLPNNSWVVVARNRKLADLQKVEGFFHYNTDTGIQQEAYNLKNSEMPGWESYKTCQFQRYNKEYIGCLMVRFRQNGANVEAATDQYRSFYIYSKGYEKEIVLGVDFEKYDDKTTPKRQCYNTFAEDDSSTRQGVKDLVLTFAGEQRVFSGTIEPQGSDLTIRNPPNGFSFGGTVAGGGDIAGVADDTRTHVESYEPYLPDNKWVVVAKNRHLEDLTRVDGFFHYAANTGFETTAYNLKYSVTPDRIGRKTCQFQRDNKSFVADLLVQFRQTGDDIEACTWGYSSCYIEKSGYEDLVKLGIDFELYSSSTLPKLKTYGSPYVVAEADDSVKQGVKQMKLHFKSGEVTYAAADTSSAANGVAFVGTEGTPLDVTTAASTLFPSNGIVTVGPYASLRLAGHVANPRWTKYRVMTNGTLRLKGTWQTGSQDAIDLVGGTLLSRDEEPSAKDANTRVNYLTLMNGAHCGGKPLMVGHDEFNANWIVAGDSPSFCESGIIPTAAGGSNERWFRFYVKDVTKDDGTDFFFSGGIVDYNSQKAEAGYWNVHIVKGGAGTMEVSGDITLPNEIDVKEGALLLAKSDQFKVSRHRQETGENTLAGITLSGGSVAVADGVSNAIGALAGTNGVSQVVLGANARLDVDSIAVDAGATVEVTLGDGAVLHAKTPLAPGVRRRIRIGDRSAMLDENGNVVPYDLGAVFIIR